MNKIPKMRSKRNKKPVKMKKMKILVQQLKII